PSSAQDTIFGVEQHRGLAGRGGADGFVEAHAGTVAGDLDHRATRRTAVTHLHPGFEPPVFSGGAQRAVVVDRDLVGACVLLVADHHRAGLRNDAEHVAFLVAARLEPAALTDRDAVDALVLPDDRAGGV